MNKRKTGADGEALALEYLLNIGHEKLALNYRAAGAEIDIITRDGETIVFVEVKARSTDRFGLGREAVDAKKRARITGAAEVYLAETGLADASVRFDVIEIDLSAGAIKHFKAAFMAGE